MSTQPTEWNFTFFSSVELLTYAIMTALGTKLLQMRANNAQGFV